MTYLILIFISFSASVIGSICGIGGGVIIKPVIDSLGIFSAGTVSFLSGCIVLSMAAYSVVCSKLSGSCHIDQSRSGWLGLGAAMGGLSGKKLLDLIEGITAGADRIGAVQAAVLFAVTFATVIYTLNKVCSTEFAVYNLYFSADKSAVQLCHGRNSQAALTSLYAHGVLRYFGRCSGEKDK